jgi:hypothetical protein
MPDQYVMHRIVIYAKDIEIITGKKERTARTLLSNIRKYYRKQKHQAVTIYEFCLYMDMSREEVMECLR